MVVPLSRAGHLRVTHPFATLGMNRNSSLPFDLHALGTPLAFILSQDQTLRRFQLSPEGVQVLSTGILVHDRSVSQLSPVIRPGRPPGASQRPEPASVSVTLQLLTFLSSHHRQHAGSTASRRALFSRVSFEVIWLTPLSPSEFGL